MTEFLKEWQGALVETIDARLVIIESLQVTSLFTPLPPSWWPFVISQNNTPNQTLTKLLGKIFQEFTMRQPLDNHYGNSITLFGRNERKFQDNKNQNYHNFFSNNVQTINTNKEFYKDMTCHYCWKKCHITLTCKKHKYD
jgi:hypothetical protein